MFKTLLKYWHFALLAILFMICEVTVDMIQPKLMATIVDDGILGLSGNGQPDLHVIASVTRSANSVSPASCISPSSRPTPSPLVR